MKKHILYSFILTLFLCIACTKENMLTDIDQLTVEAFLYAEQAVTEVTFGKVIHLDSTNIPAPPSDLTPTITTEEGLVYPLTYTGTNGIYANTELTIEAEKSYRLEVTYNDLTLSAETFVPPAPDSVFLSEEVIYRSKIEDITDVFDQVQPNPITVSWDGVPGAFYFVTVENTEENPEIINGLFEGQEIPAIFEVTTEPTTDNTFDIDAFRGITHYGVYRVTVFRVNPEYAALYETNNDGTGNLNEIRTNVQNGFGLFTGIDSIMTQFEVKKQ